MLPLWPYICHLRQSEETHEIALQLISLSTLYVHCTVRSLQWQCFYCVHVLLCMYRCTPVIWDNLKRHIKLICLLLACCTNCANLPKKTYLVKLHVLLKKLHADISATFCNSAFQRSALCCECSNVLIVSVHLSFETIWRDTWNPTPIN